MNPDSVLKQILAGTQTETEEILALQKIMENNLFFPLDAFVLGEPISLHAIGYTGSLRRGLTARCRRRNNSEYVVSISDVVFPIDSDGALYVGAYKKWEGTDSAFASADPARAPSTPRKSKRHKATEADLTLNDSLELVVLAIREKSARCRIPFTLREITLRAGKLWMVVPGEIITVAAHKQWNYNGHPYLSGEITNHRFDVPTIGLEPIELEEIQDWNSGYEPEIKRGSPKTNRQAKNAQSLRLVYEMDHPTPGTDPEAMEDDPILQASYRNDDGDRDGARKILMDLLEADLRCLDAHAHLGNFTFSNLLEESLMHYKAGVSIGEFSLGNGFTGLLPWELTKNRPFLRCLHGYGLCLWRQGHSDEAAKIFERLLWLNPNDHQGAKILLNAVRMGEVWKDED